MFYDYRCADCEEVFEIRATFAEKEKGLKPECPKCGSKHTKQVFSALSIGGVSTKSAGGNEGVQAPSCCMPGTGGCNFN